MFKQGDKVRINDQEHDYCGFYGTVESVIDDRLWIADDNNAARVIIATQSQVEAN
ncbi:MAG: hypothetical protein ACTS9Y_13445 [Methylophilus sp.]|uniref:hypothetical protein n=1 Tax=Methylophilus sp. TaxID=29541 RepID=UPI003F9FE7B8